MAANGLKAALESQQMAGITRSETVSIPGFGPSTPNDGFDPMKYRVRYSKIDFDDIGAISELEMLETRSIRNQGVYILSKEKFNFMDKLFLLVGYLERED